MVNMEKFPLLSSITIWCPVISFAVRFSDLYIFVSVFLPSNVFISPGYNLATGHPFTISIRVNAIAHDFIFQNWCLIFSTDKGIGLSYQQLVIFFLHCCHTSFIAQFVTISYIGYFKYFQPLNQVFINVILYFRQMFQKAPSI